MTNKDTARLHHALRRRDVAIQGGINPMPASAWPSAIRLANRSPIWLRLTAMIPWKHYHRD